MLNLSVNATCINAPFKAGTIFRMASQPEKITSPSYARLELALRTYLGSEKELEQQQVADAMNQSAQTIHNWRYRSGVSKLGALHAQKTCGASASYILTGEGPQTAAPQPPRSEPEVDISDPIQAVSKLMPHLAPADQVLVLQRVMALMPARPAAPVEQADQPSHGRGQLA